MAKINLRAGDIPETDEEVEKLLEKMERKPKVVRKKTIERQLEHHELQDWVESAETPAEMQERAEHANAGYPVIVKEEVDDVAANHEPGQALPEDQAERATSGSGWQGEEITDAEWEKMQKARKPKLHVVRKNSKGQEVQVTEKRETKKPAGKKQPKPKVEKPVSKRETGVSRVKAQVVLTIFELAKNGKSNTEIAAATSIPQSYIGGILSAHVSWVEHTKDQFAALGQSYPEKFVRSKPEKPAVRKEVGVSK